MERQTLFRGLAKDRQPAFRTGNLGRLLLTAHTNWQGALARELRNEGFPSVRRTHLSLLRHIDMDGTRITEIADRAGVTKQAVGQLVATCVEAGLVDVVSDPNDRRAKLVRFTDAGRALILAQLNVFERLDAELIDLLGDKAYKDLRVTLEKFADWQPSL
ncbi:MAG: MarR family winged helix-turn-helix transcriptional regulator [Aquisalimonadaceae bacterium]